MNQTSFTKPTKPMHLISCRIWWHWRLSQYIYRYDTKPSIQVLRFHSFSTSETRWVTCTKEKWDAHYIYNKNSDGVIWENWIFLQSSSLIWFQVQANVICLRYRNHEVRVPKRQNLMFHLFRTNLDADIIDKKISKARSKLVDPSIIHPMSIQHLKCFTTFLSEK